MGKRGLLVHRLQYTQGQPAAARSAHELDPQTQASKMAPVCSDHVFRAAARPVEALCRSRLLERGTERLASHYRAFDSLAPAHSACGLPVYVARLPLAPFCESRMLSGLTHAYNGSTAWKPLLSFLGESLQI